MKKLKLSLLAICICLTTLLTQCSSHSEKTIEDFDEHWKNLFFTETKQDEAKRFCERWTQSEDTQIQIRAHACLASIAVYTLNDQGFEVASKHIDDAMKIDPHNLMIHLLKINLDLFYDRDFETNLHQALKSLPDVNLEAWLSPLENWFQMQKYDAIKNYLLILDQYFKNQSPIQSRLGMIYLFLSDLNASENHLKSAITLDSEDISSLWSLGRVYQLKKQFTDSKNLYLKALEKLSPEDQAYGTLHCLFSQFLSESLNDNSQACAHAQNTCPEFFEQNCKESK